MSSNQLNDPELEQALLGGLLLDPSHLDQLVDFGPVIFTTPANRAVAAAILTTWRESRAVDAETVAEALQRSGEYQLVGGHQAIIELLEKYPHAGHVARHFEILLQLHHRRAAREVLLDRAAAVADRSQDWQAVSEAIEAPVGRRTGQSTEPTNAADLLQRHPTNRPALIEGLLRSGEVASVICSAKAGKSWLLGQLALSVAAGADWLGLATRRGRVLLLDLELHPENLAFRIRSLHREMGLRPEVLQSVDTIALRGSDLAVDDLARMADRWKGYSLIVLDPLYRALGERDENANSDMAKVFNLVDAAVAASGASWLVCHHASKGSQTLKSVTDVGSGAGSISRASDCHLILRPHAVPGVAVVEAAVRSFPPLPAFCASFNWPLWQRAAEDLDPTDLTGRPPSAGAKVVAARKDLEDDADAIERFLDSQLGPVHLAKIVAGVCLAGRLIHDKRAKAGLKRLMLEDRVTSRLIPAGANGRRVPGFWTCEKFAKADEDDKQKQTDSGLFPVCFRFFPVVLPQHKRTKTNKRKPDI